MDFLITIITLILTFYIGNLLIKYRKCKIAFDKAKVKEEEIERERKVKLIGEHIINRPELNNGVRKVVTNAVRVSLKDFRSMYFDCDEIIIWTQAIFTFQLQCRLEKAYIEGIGLTSEKDIGECKEFVREIIKTCHLEAVRLNPELKEY